MSLRTRLIGSSFGSLASLALFMATVASAANITWIGGNTQWDDGAGNDASWNPADEPDSNDAAIFNTNNAITLGTNNVINGLTMSASSELLLNGHQLNVDGLTSLTGSGTRLEVAGAGAALNGADVTIGNLATLQIDEGTIQSLIVGATNSTFTINGGGLFSGNGAVSMTDALVAVTTLINNNGTITASNPSTIIFTPPAAATLSFSASDADARFDLDGSMEAGVVNINRNQTLDIDIQLSDIFNGSIAMSHETKLDIASSWILGAGAVIDVDNGAVIGIPGVPAGKATIAGASFAQNSGTINVLDADGTLQFDAPFTMNGGTLANGGHVIFNQTAVIAPAANLDMIGDSDLTVEANRTVTINQTNFNFDGAGIGGTVITVNSQGNLILNVTDYDSDAATNAFDGTVNLNNGTIDVNTGDAEFVMDGVINAHADGLSQSLWTGEAIDIGNDSGALDADLNVTGSQPTQFGAQVDFNSDADVNVADGATLHFLAVVNFNSVNAANNAEFTGAGEIIFSAGVNFNETTTLNMAGGTVDLDGADSVGDTVNVDAPLTINAELLRSFGKNNGGGGTNLLDVNNSVGTGALSVNLDDPNAEWTLNGPGVMNLVNDNTEATLLAGSDVNVNGTVNVTGDVRTTARLDVAGTINVNTAGQPLRLAGGSLGDPNTINGGTISGAGALGADTGAALHGFGTINTAVDFDGASNLFADDGTLTINGSILDVNRIGTHDVDGILNVVNPWNTSAASFVTLDGGTLQGGTMTIDNVNAAGGFGTIASRVINNTGIRASGGTLVVQTAGNDNDWDGAANNASLNAQPNSTLELRDNATFGFTGTVSTFEGGKVFANGFALDFNPGSNLALGAGVYESTSSTDIGGAVNVNIGESTIKVANNFFLTFETGSSTTLGSNLRTVNNNINIEAGATFAGGGALIVPDGSHLVADNLANIGVLLDMQGAFRPGNFNGIGRVDLFDYQQGDTGELYVELIGTSLNAFDRLVASGDVLLDGYLNIDIDEVSPGVPFVPSLGQTFNIVTGNSVVGEFDYADVSGMPAGLAFHINYLANAVQLQVVNKPIFSADFDEDGDVDPTDLAIWKGAYNLNQLGDADGDNDSDGNDFLLWQQQFGSAPAVAVVQPAAAAVPEPTTAVMMLSLLALSAFRAQRRAS